MASSTEIHGTGGEPPAGFETGRIRRWIDRLFSGARSTPAEDPFNAYRARLRLQLENRGWESQVADDAVTAIELFHRAGVNPVARKGEVRTIERGGLRSPWRELDYGDQDRQRHINDRALGRSRPSST